MTPVDVFVAPTGNQFFDDIGAWIVEAASILGHPARLVDDRLPLHDGSINLVVAPHEFFELVDAPAHDLQRAAACSVGICTEQPGTPWFHHSIDACRRGLLTIDINPLGVEALRAVGVEAAHLQLGAVPSMTVARPTELGAPGRDLDVLFMGGLDDRRGALLAGLAPRLWRRATDLRLFRFERPSRADSPGARLRDRQVPTARRRSAPPQPPSRPHRSAVR